MRVLGFFKDEVFWVGYDSPLLAIVSSREAVYFKIMPQFGELDLEAQTIFDEMSMKQRQKLSNMNIGDLCIGLPAVKGMPNKIIVGHFVSVERCLVV